MCETMIKVIVAGSRTFTNFSLCEKELIRFIKTHHRKGIMKSDIEIVSGTARGADKLGEKFAIKYGFKVTQFPAEWDKYGKSAGYIRNKQMAEYATHCIVFWDGISKGSQHMIDLAKSRDLVTNVIKYV